jgi:hypothetical protein
LRRGNSDEERFGFLEGRHDGQEHEGQERQWKSEAPQRLSQGSERVSHLELELSVENLKMVKQVSEGYLVKEKINLMHQLINAASDADQP